jgi:hypothetical protein
VTLSSEDVLRLNVLLANDIEAVRIDENSMTVCGLTGDNEARVKLNPNCRPDVYLRRVREMLSSHVLGSPGGYPVFLQRWTRMGQTRDGRLEDLLKLGEPEAVIAVAGAPGLTDELARRAWWVASNANNARRMLEREVVSKGSMGKVLAEFLVEHLPFETDPQTIISTVRLVLQPGLIDDEAKGRIWARGEQKNVYRIGFLAATPDQLPNEVPPRPDLQQYRADLSSLAGRGNSLAALLMRLFDSSGQNFLAVTESVLRRPANQDVVVALLNAVGTYFQSARQAGESTRDFDQIVRDSESCCRTALDVARDGNGPLAALLAAVPDLRHEIIAMLSLARVDEEIVIPIFSKTTADGTLMRSKIEPVMIPLFRQLAVMRGTGDAS